MTMNTIALTGLLFISAAAAGIVCLGGPTACTKAPGYIHTMQNPIAKGSTTFKGFTLGNATSNAPPANWTWELNVGNYSTGGHSTQLYEVYSLRIPPEVELSGPNVNRNVCMILLPYREGVGANDPGDCSTIFGSDDIQMAISAGMSNPWAPGRSPCAWNMQQIYSTLIYRTVDPGLKGSFASATLFGHDSNDTRVGDPPARIIRVSRPIPVNESQAAIDTLLTRVQPIYLQTFSTVENDKTNAQVALRCLHVNTNSSVRGAMVGMGSVIASAVITVGFLML
ncbi:hypothetical protein GX51_04691 [Blastomyces parvus]|uniref:Uncharacterized protein n=1 Tax=Blastomyces parvus TaxID=2060905 RepID=A0A2B7X0S2_9EURO|nr:hypothetical protein GX51_04691 [Blastomyces parvus]